MLGATGHTGGAVVDRLLAAGEAVRAVGRSQARLAPLGERGAEVAVGNALDETFLTQAMSGARAVYAMIPPDYSRPDVVAYYDETGTAIARAIRSANVRRLVFLSSLGAELPSGTGPVATLHRQEERLEGMDYDCDLMLLRAGYFYENHFPALRLIKERGVNGDAIAPDVPIPMVATADIGAAAAEELLDPSWRGTVVREVLGPRDYTKRETTRILGEKIGRPDLEYLQFPDADVKAALVAAGISPGIADSILELDHALSAGTIRSLAGRDGAWVGKITFEEFAEQLAAAYRTM